MADAVESRIECDRDELAGRFQGGCGGSDLAGTHGIAASRWPDKDLSAAS
jgi:hypothetical protein